MAERRTATRAGSAPGHGEGMVKVWAPVGHGVIDSSGRRHTSAKGTVFCGEVKAVSSAGTRPQFVVSRARNAVWASPLKCEPAARLTSPTVRRRRLSLHLRGPARQAEFCRESALGSLLHCIARSTPGVASCVSGRDRFNGSSHRVKGLIHNKPPSVQRLPIHASQGKLTRRVHRIKYRFRNPPGVRVHPRPTCGRRSRSQQLQLAQKVCSPRRL